jgi:hypothetical protein
MRQVRDLSSNGVRVDTTQQNGVAGGWKPRVSNWSLLVATIPGGFCQNFGVKVNRLMMKIEEESRNKVANTILWEEE